MTAVQVFQLAQSTASAYLEKKLCFIVLHCFHWRDDVCADALLKHFFMHNIMQACLWVFAVIRVYII